MTKLIETLGMRKELLQARSAIYRIKMHQDIRAINEKVSGARAAIISSRPIKSIVAGMALQYLGHSRLARMLAWAGRALMVIKIANVVIKLYRSPAVATTESQAPPTHVPTVPSSYAPLL